MSSTTRRYTVRFGSALIDTTVTTDAAVADEWVRGVRATAGARGSLIVGLDCEWRPNYTPWETSKVATLQLCVGTSCLILQLFHAACVPASIRSFLGDPAVRCVGLGVGEDAAKLFGDYGLVCATPVDLESICNERVGYYFGSRLGLKGYARELLGLTMEKPMHVTRSDWQSRDLSLAQIEYACIDAYVSYKLGELVLLN